MRTASTALFLALLAGSAAAEESSRPPNHPPRLSGVHVDPSLPDFVGGTLRSGRTTRISFLAEDADGDVLEYSAGPLPSGATMDRAQGIVTWRPTHDQEGQYSITVTVTDGRATAKQTFVIGVHPNRPPSEGGDRATYRTLSSVGPQSSLVANDPDADELTYEVRQLPSGARLVAMPGSISLSWAPSAADVGEHEIVIDISDGEFRRTIRHRVLVLPEWAEQDYRGWLLPGGGPTAFLTHGDGKLFLGGAFDATLVALREDGWSGYACARHIRAYGCHASNHRFYGRFEVLDPMKRGEPSLFAYGIGYSASLEWYPARRFLIPHYGVEVGGLVRDGVGHRAQVHPYLGLHLWAGNDFWLNATLGYRVVPADLLDLSGPTLAVTAIVNPW